MVPKYHQKEEEKEMMRNMINLYFIICVNYFSLHVQMFYNYNFKKGKY